MIVSFHKNFEKQYKKLNSKEKEKIKENISILIKNESDPILNNHPLKGKYKGYRSMNITGDLRAIYKRTEKEKVIFITIGNHSNLYK